MILSIVILSYNTEDLVIDCTKSLESQFADELKNDFVEIIVVDNASEKKIVDGIEKFVKDHYNVRFIKNKENLGFGRGCNTGAENSKGKYVLFLNSDTLVEDKGFMEMTKFLDENPNVGILGGKLMNFDSTPQPSSGKFYNLFNFFIMLFGGEKFGLLRSNPEKISRVDWVSGACMMVNKSLFEKVGEFDKNIFMYTEDMELSYRAKKSGILTYYYPDISVKHMSQGSSSRSFAIYYIYKGILYFYKKHKNLLEYKIVKVCLLIKAFAIYFLGKITHNSYYTKAYGKTLELF